MEFKLKRRWKWLARDEDGKFFIFDTKPVFQDNRWVCEEEWYNATELHIPLFDIPESYKLCPAKDALWGL